MFSSALFGSSHLLCRTLRAIIARSFLFCLAFTGAVWAVEENRAPEAATGTSVKTAVRASRYLVVTADPRATESGSRILAAGGSAVDAAIAVQMVLNLVEPQSSGIGGGAFMLHWDQKQRQIDSYDGRETAPATATPDLFLNSDGSPMKMLQAIVGGRSVGTPGVLAMLKLAHQQHGKLPWKRLFDDAIRLAEQGFIVSPRLAELLQKSSNPGLAEAGAAHDYFYPDGQPITAGSRLVNQPYAKLLRRVANQGPAAFYQGKTAQKMVAAVHAHHNPGQLSLQDLASYQAQERPPLCGGYRGYRICGMGPPSSGGVTLLQMLALLEPFDLAALKPLSAESVQLFSQAGRLAFADRALYLADSDFVSVPVKALLDPDYLRQRAQLMQRGRDMGLAPAGKLVVATQGKDSSPELPSTSHFSIVDGNGNALSMTSSIETAFGSTVMVEGFLLNNQLTDFSFLPEQDGQPVANRITGGKRPRSSMAPTMVFDAQGELKWVLGSPGGARIIPFVAQSLIALIDWQLDLQQAIDLPHYQNRNDRTELEAGTDAVSLQKALEAMGHVVEVRDLNSGINAIERSSKALIGAADSRREGSAAGL